MLTGWGKTLSDKIFTSHLNWRWGIKPFVSDVKKMINFVELTNRRFKLLKRLQRGEIVKQRCALDSGETREPARRLTLSSTGGAVVSAWANTTYTYRTWGSMQWKLRKMDKTHPMTDERLLKKAKSMVLGWDSYELVLATWELIPWSWFIDWFFHLSDILTACKGVCTYQWANGCMMRTLTSTTTYDIENPYAPGQWWTCSGSHKESMVRRQRWPIAPVGPPIDVVGPLLTGKTWSILGTLWVLKSKSGTARALRS